MNHNWEAKVREENKEQFQVHALINTDREKKLFLFQTGCQWMAISQCLISLCSYTTANSSAISTNEEHFVLRSSTLGRKYEANTKQ